MNELRVLLVDNDLCDARFIQEALTEMEERTHGGAWIHCRVTHLESADDAAIVLENEPPDVVLFNPTLAGSRGLETFAKLQDAAPGVPLVALLDSGEEGLGRRMLRQGAQDYVMKCEVDCQPLARAMLNAIERQRFSRSAQLASSMDLETGFHKGDSFRALARREIQLARLCGRPAALVLAELDNLMEVDAACGRQAAHELIVEAANVVRAAVGETALVGREGLGRFAVLALGQNCEELVFELQRAIQAGLHSFAFVFGYGSISDAAEGAVDDLMQTAEAALYENKQAYSNIN